MDSWLIPGQYMVDLALCWHLVIAWCPSWTLLRNSFRIDCRIITLSPLRISPSSMLSSSRKDHNFRTLEWTSLCVSGKPCVMSFLSRNSSLSWSVFCLSSSILVRENCTKATWTSMLIFSSIVCFGSLDRLSASVIWFPGL